MKTPEWYAEDLRRHHEEKKRTSIGMMKEHYADVAAIAETKKRNEEGRKRILAQVAQRKAAQATESLKNAKHIQAPKANPQEAPVKEPKTTKRKKQLEELESLHKEIKQTKIPDLSSLKRKHQLVEMEMLKKEIENSKIPDIKLDSSIKGMIIKLDSLTKSNVLRKQVKYLLEEFEKDMITNIKSILFKIDILINKL
jgi:hypothetical protein